MLDSLFRRGSLKQAWLSSAGLAWLHGCLESVHGCWSLSLRDAPLRLVKTALSAATKEANCTTFDFLDVAVKKDRIPVKEMSRRCRCMAIISKNWFYILNRLTVLFNNPHIPVFCRRHTNAVTIFASFITRHEQNSDLLYLFNGHS